MGVVPSLFSLGLRLELLTLVLLMPTRLAGCRHPPRTNIFRVRRSLLRGGCFTPFVKISGGPGMERIGW